MIFFSTHCKKIEPLIKYSEVMPPNMTGDIFWGTPVQLEILVTLLNLAVKNQLFQLDDKTSYTNKYAV